MDATAPLEQRASRGIARLPAVIHTATLRIVAKNFDGIRATVEGIVSQAGGFVDQMTVTGDNAAARELRGTLRVPGNKMADALTRLRQIGQSSRTRRDRRTSPTRSSISTRA